MTASTNKHEDLIRLAENKKVLLVFLRHFGCTFCRETMTRLAEAKDELESQNTKIVVVHMVSSKIADRLLNLYDLKGVSHISDPEKELYHYFGLKNAEMNQYFNPKNWWRAFTHGVLKGHLIGKPAGDVFQMPGVFLFHKKQILNKFTYKYVSDMPDFLKLTTLA
ncbi:AhpC/TSA family protein [Cryomorpha ignava]|uniref:AhpC/TSA family protein n=1 Tax=Cryomorpha ignava TaxID=101383 RepID=A0A7K3WK92_9FLAO|nr:peroxiredoxin-like family protein [Cryomorpha ignava]NEN22073.1 AhpC/TSA family protein [Cryomorpha ignava]